MATLQAVTKDMSKRMLTRLTPRGTSNANFLKTIRTKPLNSGHSLRGRDVSVSTDEEEEEEEEYANSSKSRKSGKPPQQAQQQQSSAKRKAPTTTASTGKSKKSKTKQHKERPNKFTLFACKYQHGVNKDKPSGRPCGMA